MFDKVLKAPLTVVKPRSFIVDVPMGSKFTSGITFTVEKVYKISIFVLYSQCQLC